MDSWKLATCASPQFADFGCSGLGMHQRRARHRSTDNPDFVYNSNGNAPRVDTACSGELDRARDIPPIARFAAVTSLLLSWRSSVHSYPLRHRGRVTEMSFALLLSKMPASSHSGGAR